jgi:hypothetical protein
MSTPEILCPELIRYLEEVLALARKGRVIYFSGAAGAINPEVPGDLSILVGAALSGHAQVLDETSLRKGMEATGAGLVKASEAVFKAVEEEIDFRHPRVLM